MFKTTNIIFRESDTYCSFGGCYKGEEMKVSQNGRKKCAGLAGRATAQQLGLSLGRHAIEAQLSLCFPFRVLSSLPDRLTTNQAAAPSLVLPRVWATAILGLLEGELI